MSDEREEPTIADEWLAENPAAALARERKALVEDMLAEARERYTKLRQAVAFHAGTGYLIRASLLEEILREHPPLE